MGTDLLLGRVFSVSDRIGAPGVAIVNLSFVQRFLSRGTAIGQTLRYRDDRDAQWREVQIVGVVKNAVYRFVRETAPPTIYLPLAQVESPLPSAVVAVLRSGVPLDNALRRAVTKALLGVDPQVAVQFRLLSEQLEAQYSQEKLLALVATVFGVAALLLAAIGLYGVTAYDVTRRRVEIGIRIALGASAGRVRRAVLKRVVVQVGAGLILGVAGAHWATRLIRGLLFGVESGELGALAVGCALIAAVAGAAAWGPVRRASATDPAIVLKNA